MKLFISIFIMGVFLLACQPAEDNSANEAFEKNSATVLAYLQDWQNENVDYDKYFAENAWFRPTAFGSPDSLTLDKMKEYDAEGWKSVDFKMPKDIVFLPGVNALTKEVDGSVRYYGNWTVTLPATDSTEAKDFVVKVYDSFDFNDEGKIMFVQTYGDWGGMNEAMEDYMEGDSDDDSEGEAEMEAADEEAMD